MRRAAYECAEEEEFIGVKGIGWVVVEIVVVDGGQLFCFGFVAGFFPDFAEGGDAGRVTDVSPSAREGPAPSLRSLTRRMRSLSKTAARTSTFGVA